MRGKRALALVSATALMMSMTPAMQSFADEASYKVTVENVRGGYVRASYQQDLGNGTKATVYLPVGETSMVPAGTSLRAYANSGHWNNLKTNDSKLLVDGEEPERSYDITVDKDMVLSAEFDQEEYTSSSDEENYTGLRFKSTNSSTLFKPDLGTNLDETLEVYDEATEKSTDLTDSLAIDYVNCSNIDGDYQHFDKEDIPFVIENGHLKVKAGSTLPEGAYNYSIRAESDSIQDTYLSIDMIYGLSASTSFVKFGRSSSSASISVDIATGTDQVKKYYDGSQLQIANHPFVSASYSNGDLKGKALGDNQTVAQAATKYGRVSLKASFKDFTPTLVLPKENLSDDFYEAQKLPFNDVDANVWSAPYIKYAFYNGLMTGKSDTKFDPTGDFTRAQAVVVLYAAAGKPDVEITSKFSDLSADWYKKAVSWAVENGITGGTGDGSTFSPDDKVTKEQLALFLMKYAEFCDKDTSERKDISGFADAGKVDGWAKDAVEWAAAAGVITGDGTNIQPQGFADRQTAATMFRTAMKNVLLA